MIGFFPDPYPDELLYSACARYSDRVNYRNKQSHRSELLGILGLSAVVDFPNRLEHLVSILPPGNNYSAEIIINQNTLLPFYEPFLPSRRAELIRQEMKDGSKYNTLRARIATTVKQVRMPEYLRFCPLCVEEDKKEFGETYWHRLHQLPGVLVCPDHLCFLENSSLEWKRGVGGRFYSAEGFVSQQKSRSLNQANFDHQILIKLATNAKWLLSQNHISIENSVIRDRYYNQLLKKELAYCNDRIRTEKLCKEFQDFYSPLIFEILGCSNNSVRRGWIFRIVSKSKADILHHPIRHLLIMNFLGFSAEEFFTSFVDFKPFVDGPYPCLNRASNHFGEMKIQQCEVFDYLTKGERRGKPIAIFECDCGFAYQRVGPDKSEDDRFRYDSVRQHGEMWEEKLEELWNDLSLSRAEIGRQLKISDLSVTYHAKRLKLPMNAPGARVSNDNTHRRKKIRRTLAENREIYRKKWLEIIKENPQMSRTELVKAANFEYLWLMRNDKKWIKAHLPDSRKYIRRGEFFDWKKIDDEMAAKVEIAFQEIYQAIPLKRASITELIRRVGNRNRIEKRELKLPKTTRIINENLESLEDFMIRKLRFAEKLFIEEREIPTRLQLMVRAVIRNTTTYNSEKIQNEIDESLKRILKNLTTI